MGNNKIEYVLTEDSYAGLLQTINGLAAKYRKTHDIKEVFISDNKGKIVFEEIAPFGDAA